MKSRLTLTLALLLCSGAALAQTPDGQTPAEETVCDSETGAAFGLCNAYCEAMDCESADPQASATACTKVKDKFTQLTGRSSLPCEAPTTCPPPPPGTACPCVDAFPNFATVVIQFPTFCSDDGSRVFMLASGGSIDATCSDPTLGSRCSYFDGRTFLEALTITPEQGAACMELIRFACTSG